jgi:hypothetical protein
MTNVSSLNATTAYGGIAPANYRAISMIENSQLNNSVMLNTTQLLSNRHASISGGVPSTGAANRKNSPGKSLFLA